MNGIKIFQKVFQKGINFPTNNLNKFSATINPFLFSSQTNSNVNLKFTSRILMGSYVTANSLGYYATSHLYSTQNESNEEIEIACVINPHPSKRKTGGEDAYYFSKDLRSFGVADGVGGWASHGVDPGLYSKRLMTLMKTEEDREENYNKNSLINSITTAHKIITKEKTEGSTTLCFVKIIEKNLQSYLLGDSGYMIVSHNAEKFYKSPEQQKSFNFPYQLGSVGDKISDGRNKIHPINVGDFILLATDGIFDNLDEEYIFGIVKEDKEKSVLEIAARIVNEATLVAFNKHPGKHMNITPFQINSDGYFKGGKPDDMTMIVARVKKL